MEDRKKNALESWIRESYREGFKRGVENVVGEIVRLLGEYRDISTKHGPFIRKILDFLRDRYGLGICEETLEELDPGIRKVTAPMQAQVIEGEKGSESSGRSAYSKRREFVLLGGGGSSNGGPRGVA